MTLTKEAETQDSAPTTGAKENVTTSPRAGESPWKKAGLRLVRNRTAMGGLVMLSLILLMVIIGPFVAPYDPVKINAKAPLKPPSAEHWFGTDDLGRDIFSRVLTGGRETLRVGMLAVLIALAGGVLIGLVCGYFEGPLDLIIQRLVEILLAFPSILFLLSIVAALGPSLTTVLVALGITSIPGYVRLVRGSVLAVKNVEYVTAARVIGAKDSRIMFAHILPNMIAPILVYGTLGLGSSIMLTAGLSYIGLGAQPPSPEWGAMLNYGRSFLKLAWWMSVFPGLMVFLSVLSINLVGDGLRDALDPRMQIS